MTLVGGLSDPYHELVVVCHYLSVEGKHQRKGVHIKERNALRCISFVPIDLLLFTNKNRIRNACLNKDILLNKCYELFISEFIIYNRTMYYVVTAKYVLFGD